MDSPTGLESLIAGVSNEKNTRNIPNSNAFQMTTRLARDIFIQKYSLWTKETLLFQIRFQNKVGVQNTPAREI